MFFIYQFNINFQYIIKLYYFLIFFSGINFAKLTLKEYSLEPISIISIIVQLANATPQIDKYLTQKDNKVYSRTETIEIYREHMNYDTYNNK